MGSMTKFFLLLLVVLIAVLVSASLLLKIKSVTCKSQLGDCDEKLKSRLQKNQGASIFTAFRESANILKNDKNILACSINLKLPLTLEINIIKRIPLVAFKLNNGKYGLVDKDGFITDEVTQTNLPKILNSEPLSKDELIFVTSLMESLNIFYNVNTGKINDSALIVEIQSKKVFFPISGDKDVLLGSLNLIFSRLQGNKDTSTIDLRFKNPVLR